LALAVTGRWQLSDQAAKASDKAFSGQPGKLDQATGTQRLFVCTKVGCADAEPLSAAAGDTAEFADGAEAAEGIGRVEGA
jgi:hypothetical protein